MYKLYQFTPNQVYVYDTNDYGKYYCVTYDGNEYFFLENVFQNGLHMWHARYDQMGNWIKSWLFKPLNRFQLIEYENLKSIVTSLQG